MTKETNVDYTSMKHVKGLVISRKYNLANV